MKMDRKINLFCVTMRCKFYRTLGSEVDGYYPMTGNEVFQRKDGSYTYDLDTSEEVIVGDSNPDVEGNFGSTVRYKGFSFSVNFRYRYGDRSFCQHYSIRLKG